MAEIQGMRRGAVARWWVSGRWVQTLIAVLLAIFAVAMVYPFFWLILSSFKTSGDIIQLPVRLHLLLGEGDFEF